MRRAGAAAVLALLAGPAIARQEASTVPPCAARVDRLADPDRYPAYRVPVRRTGRRVPPVFRSPDTRVFRTEVRDQVREGPNFAGGLRLVEIGCGAGASCVLVADPATGRVTYSPALHIAVEDLDLPPTEALHYRRDSRLVVVAGYADEDGGPPGLHFFAWERGRLREARPPIPVARLCPASPSAAAPAPSP